MELQLWKTANYKINTQIVKTDNQHAAMDILGTFPSKLTKDQL